MLVKTAYPLTYLLILLAFCTALPHDMGKSFLRKLCWAPPLRESLPWQVPINSLVVTWKSRMMKTRGCGTLFERGCAGEKACSLGCDADKEVAGATKKIPLPICVPISWKPPAVDSLELNTDSSSIGNPGIGGAETIIRDHNGSWIIGSHCHFPFATNIETELWAVRDRLTLARRLDLRHLDIEVDATLIIHFMSNNSFSNPTLFPLIDKYDTWHVKLGSKAGI
ncbi:hypothetical protein J1N35_008169 [Gossypium stocksii]|uniref:RNase H type-1 domain-containing protein n=1 Tax=Gossypium stocksii TaxID=47602 RepID=A0A9D3W8L3_9ROSI|nr:hypothetical protein J1N35_008169 [Gossypium stocksii]